MLVILKHFEKKGIIASFVPKMGPLILGNGGHVHLSLWKMDGVDKPYNIVGDNTTEYKMSPFFQSFMAGIKHHYPALSQFMAPTHNSIRRLEESGHWAGNFIVWGYDNKRAVLRIPSPVPKQKGTSSLSTETADAGVTNLELKTFDHSSNIFLALANVIACGLDGIKKGLTLPPPVASDPGTMTEEERV